MKSTALLIAALGVLACAPAVLAQPADAPAAVTPGQIEAAEKAFQARARATFRTIARTPAQRLAAVQAVRAAATAGDLGATVTLTPRAPWASEKAWLNATLGISDVQDDFVSMFAYPDAFAPQGAIDVVIKAAPGKRYLVECSALTMGSSNTRVTVHAGDTPASASRQIKQDTAATSAPASVVSMVTPATNAPYLRVTLDVARDSIGAAGMAVLGLDKCEVTPFS